MINKIIIGRKGRTIMIEFRNVSKTYDTGTEAIHNANFKIDKGEFCFLVGSSGSGKSTLIKMILKEEEPSSGNIIINGKDTTFLKPSRVPYLRRSMGIVFQDFRLLPDKTVYENVAFAMYVVKATPKHIRRQVPMVLSLVGLSNKAKVYPNELSGGEQQRVALARAIVNNPSMLIADEPTGNLDPNTAWDIMELLNDINLRGTTVVVATHAKDIVDKMNKRVIRIDHGNIVRDEKGGYDSDVPGDINKSKVKIKDEVDYDTPGSYEITYSVKSGKSRTGTVRLIVIVTE